MKTPLHIVSTVSVMTLIVPFLAFAHEGEVVAQTSTIRQERMETQKENRMERKVMNKSSREERRKLRDAIDDERRALLPQLKTLSVEERKAKLQAFHEDAKERRGEMHKEIKDTRVEFRMHAKERKEALKKHVGEIRAKRIEDFFNHMIERMEAAIDRFEKLGDRIENRLDKIAAEGKNVAEQRTLLEKARVSITVAQTSLDEAKIQFSKMASSTAPREEFAKVKNVIQNVHAKIKEAHAALVDVINSIKRGRLDVTSTTTSTQ